MVSVGPPSSADLQCVFLPPVGLGGRCHNWLIRDSSTQAKHTRSPRTAHCHGKGHQALSIGHWLWALIHSPLCVWGRGGDIGNPQETAVRNFYFFVMLSGVWWVRSPLIPVLERPRQVDLCEFKDSQSYIERLSQDKMTVFWSPSISLIWKCPLSIELAISRKNTPLFS